MITYITPRRIYNNEFLIELAAALCIQGSLEVVKTEKLLFCAYKRMNRFSYFQNISNTINFVR